MTHVLLSLFLSASRAASPAEGVVNALALLAGAKQLDASGEPIDHADALIDSVPDQGWEPAVADSHEAIFKLAENYDLSRAEVLNSSNEPNWPGISVKRMRIEAGAGAGGPWRPLADLKLEKKVAPQSFKISGKAVRYVKVTLTANYGNPEWFGIGELSLFGRPSETRKVDFNGAWDTNYGEMRLTQSGQRIFGCYGRDHSKAGNSTVDGTLEGRVFAGTWSQRSENERRTGLMVLALTREGELSGVWGGNDPKERNQHWDGKRLAAATIVCEPPESSLGKELSETGRVVLRGILFDTGKAVIRTESAPVLKELAAAMKAAPGKTYLIEGHTDDRGGREFNQVLSEKRSASVKAWLEKAGVTAKLRPVGYGLSRPTAPNTTDGGRAANRRVEVSVE
jgi:OOP family OmpA-OmpF porin